MDSWGLFLSAMGAIIALMALLCPSLVYLGMKLGTLQQSADGAHKRIDRLEELLKEEFQELRAALRESIDTAWRNCPLAHETHHDKEHS